MQAPSAHNPVRPPTGGAEQWRPVVGLEERYQVSDLGRVRNAAGLVLRTHPAGNTRAGRPYQQIKLCGEQRFSVFVHQLVALAFLGAAPDGTHVHHVNGNPADNRACNLVYVPARAHHSAHAQGEANPNALLCAADVRAIRWMLGRGERVADVARSFAVNPSVISKIKCGRTWAHVVQQEA